MASAGQKASVEGVVRQEEEDLLDIPHYYTAKAVGMMPGIAFRIRRCAVPARLRL
jgi:hypothetical protein